LSFTGAVYGRLSSVFLESSCFAFASSDFLSSLAGLVSFFPTLALSSFLS
jgi:hypothetical protein